VERLSPYSYYSERRSPKLARFGEQQTAFALRPDSLYLTMTEDKSKMDCFY